MTGVKESKHRMKEKKVVSDYVIIISMVIVMVVVFVTTLYPCPQAPTMRRYSATPPFGRPTA